MSADIWTVKRLLEWTTSFLKGHNSASPRLEAEILLAHALGLSRIELYTNFETIPDDAQKSAFRGLVKRRSEGEPVAYLTGRKEFYSIEFEVTPDVLIPRPETEQLALEGIEFLRARQKSGVEEPPRICDLGTGSGALAVALAKNLPTAQVTAVDLSPKALAAAQKNAEKQKVADRMTFCESDLFAKIPAGAIFDLLVSNPPYVSRAEYDALDETVRRFEPKGALLAGENGTEIVERILADAPHYLAPGGKILIEISPMIAERVELLAEENGNFSDIAVLKDFAGLRRTLAARKK